MVEQPKSVIVESQTRLVDDSEPDAPLEKSEKGRLIDEEVIVLQEQPVTASLHKTIAHLQRIGGARSRWRGLGISIVYHVAHSLTSAFFLNFAGFSPFYRPVVYIISSVLLARFHMAWTHIMISAPSALPWYKRMIAERAVMREQYKTLILPSFVFAVAQQLAVILPFFVFLYAAEGVDRTQLPISDKSQQKQLAMAALAAVASAGFFAFLILLPASVTLTRIEASLISEDQETVVSIDRTLNGATEGGVNLDGARPKSLFIEAWRSFDRPARLRLLKFYVKMGAILVGVALVGMQVVACEIFLIGPENLKNLVVAGIAQLRLAAMGVGEN